MFQRKIDELFWGLPNVFGILDDILIVGLNEMGRDHDATLNKAMKKRTAFIPGYSQLPE